MDWMAPDKIVIVARFEGRCSCCYGRIAPGERIEKTNAGWMHEDCPGDPPDNWYDIMDMDPDIGDR